MFATDTLEAEYITETIHGQFVDIEMNKYAFRLIVRRLMRLLEDFIIENQLGQLVDEADVIFSEQDKPRPDIVYVSNKNQSILVDYIRGVPDLVVEVVSDNSFIRDAEVKKAMYESYGVPEYWLVLPATKQILVYLLVNGVYEPFSSAWQKGRVKSSVLAGFEIEIEPIFK